MSTDNNKLTDLDKELSFEPYLKPYLDLRNKKDLEIYSTILSRKERIDKKRIVAIIERLKSINWLTPLYWEDHLCPLDEAIHILGTEKALEMFENENLDNLAKKVQSLENSYELGSDHKFISINDMVKCIEILIRYLKLNENHLIDFGYPKFYPSDDILFLELANLYPTKIPVGLNFFDAGKKEGKVHFIWSTKQPFINIDGNILLLRFSSTAYERRNIVDKDNNPLTFCTYEDAPIINGLKSEHAKRFESIREKVFRVKVQILKRIIKSIKTQKVNNFWNDCQNILIDTFLYDDIAFMLRIDSFYDRIRNYGEIYNNKFRHSLSYPATKVPYNVDCFTFQKGLSTLLEAIGCVESWITIKAGQRLQKHLIGIPRVNNYYEVINKPWRNKFDALIDFIDSLYSEINEFWRDYTCRVNNSLENEFYEEIYLRKKVKRKLKNKFKPQMITFANYLNQALESGTSWGVNLGKPIQQPRKRSKRRRQRKTLQLTKRQQEAYSFVNIQGKTLGEAAIEMGCSKQNVSALLKKAEEKVKAMHSNSRSVNFRNMQTLPTDNRDQAAIGERDSRAKNSPHLTKK